MKNKYILGNGVVADGLGLLFENGAVAVEDGKIASVGPSGGLRSLGWQWLDVGGRLILPGLANMHHHLYSHFSAGLSPHRDSPDFMGVLRGLWWPLDAVMDSEAVYWSGLCGALDALSHGVTTVFDHHASMNCTELVLDDLSRGIDAAGIRSVLCLEISDRLGKDKVKGQFKENLRFFESAKNCTTRKGMLGLHANLTLSEETMAYLAEAKPCGMAVHVHCGEAAEDLEYCRSLGYRGPVDRLDSFGLLSQDSLLVHCVHLSPGDYEILDRIGPGVVTNPESNANNRVGAMDRDRIGSFLLGTDGMTGDMVASLRSAFLMDRGCKSPLDSLSLAFFSNRYDFVRKFFPRVSGLEIGSEADLTVLDYVPLTSVSPENLLAHLIFGAKGGKAFLTAVGGKILWQEGRFTAAKSQDLYARAREVSHKLHSRFFENDWNDCLKGGKIHG